MNTYIVKSVEGKVLVASFEATDSDYACWTASDLAKKAGVPPQRATLVIEVDGKPQPLGEFELEGFVPPTAWKQVQAIIKELRQEAKSDGQRHFDYPFFQYREVVIYGEDNNGQTLFGEGEEQCIELPRTAKAYWAMIESIRSEHPTLAVLKAVAAVDGANSLSEWLNGNYQPVCGEAEGVIHRY